MLHGFEIQTADGPKSLRYDFNAICSMESAAGRELLALGSAPTGAMPTLAQLAFMGPTSTARIMLWAGLLHNGDGSLKDAGAVLQSFLDHGGTMEDLSDKMNEALEAAGYKTEASEEEKKEEEDDPNA